jgi:hypothetical protein
VIWHIELDNRIESISYDENEPITYRSTFVLSLVFS